MRVALELEARMRRALHRWMWPLLLLGALPSVGRAQEGAPKIDHQPVTQATAGQALFLRARIVSMSGKPIGEATAYVRLPGVVGYSRLPMKADAAFKDLYSAEFPAAYVAGDFEYYLEAFDAEGNGPGRIGSPEVPLHVAVAVPRAAAPPPIAPIVPAAPVGPIVETGNLRVITDPPGAMVSVDGQRVGVSPHVEQVRAGVSHRLQVEAAGYVPVTVEVAVPANTEGLADLKLEREQQISRFLINVTGSYGLPGPFVQDTDLAKAFLPGMVDRFAIRAAYGLSLSFTGVLARHHGLAIELSFNQLEIKTDVPGYEDKAVVKGTAFGALVGYRAMFGPFSVVRPHLGLLVGVWALNFNKGEGSLGWTGSQGMRVSPTGYLELGVAFEIPAHITLDISFRAGFFEPKGPLLLLSPCASIGTHF